MKLVLTVVEGGASLPESSRARILSSSDASTTLSIGRGADNDWVLPSGEMNISRRHCSIAFDNGQFVLTDSSINGVYINRAPKPTERNSRVPLNGGDVIGVGNYVMSIALVDDRPAPDTGNHAANGDSGRMSLDADPLANPPHRPPDPSPLPRMVASRRGADPFETQSFHSTGPVDPDVDGFDGIRPSADWQGLPTPDHAPATSQAVALSRVIASRRVDFDALIGHLPGHTPVVPVIAPAPKPAAPPDPSAVDFARSPDDRQNASDPASDSGESPAPDGVPDRPPTEASRGVSATRRQESDPPRSIEDAYAGLVAFLDGAGIPMDRIDRSNPEATLRAAGKVFRAMAVGFQQVLKSRAAVKSDLGISPTIIAGTGNNPLKFSVTAEEAVRLLLTPRAAGYMDPLAATQQAAKDIQSHELAVMAGMQEALLSMLHRFDPDELEKRLGAGMLGNLVPAARKARYWEAFKQTYSDLSRESEDEFKNVFGRPFTRAYNAQTRKD